MTDETDHDDPYNPPPGSDISRAQWAALFVCGLAETETVPPMRHLIRMAAAYADVRDATTLVLIHWRDEAEARGDLEAIERLGTAVDWWRNLLPPRT